MDGWILISGEIFCCLPSSKHPFELSCLSFHWSIHLMSFISWEHTQNWKGEVLQNKSLSLHVFSVWMRIYYSFLILKQGLNLQITISTITVWLSGELIHACVQRIKEASGGKSLRVYYVARSRSGMTVKTFMAPNLYKQDMQRRTGNRTLMYMVICLKEDKGKNPQNILLLFYSPEGKLLWRRNQGETNQSIIYL